LFPHHLLGIFAQGDDLLAGKLGEDQRLLGFDIDDGNKTLFVLDGIELGLDFCALGGFSLSVSKKPSSGQTKTATSVSTATSAQIRLIRFFLTNAIVTSVKSIGVESREHKLISQA